MQTMVIKIRRAKKEDLGNLMRLYIGFLKYNNQFARFVGPNQFLIHKKELRNSIRKDIKQSKKKILLIAEENQKLIGFVQADVMSHRESRTDKEVVEVLDIYSRSKRKGTGKKLLKEVEKWADSKEAKFIL